MNDALTAAHQRLQDALRAGEDTEPHRRAIALLEAAHQQRLDAARALIDAAKAETAAEIDARADALLAEARGEVAQFVGRLARVPEFSGMEPTND